MVPSPPPPHSDKEKEAHENAGEGRKGVPDENGWIKTSERLPEVASGIGPYDFHKTSEYVIVWSELDQHPCIGKYSHKFNEWYGLEMEILWSVNHWQPLPNPPKDN